MARLPVDPEAVEKARQALIDATAAHEDALLAVPVTRRAQHAAIVAARLDGIRQKDITPLTALPRAGKPRGLAREHLRRIEREYRRKLLHARARGDDTDAMSILDVFNVVLPGDENDLIAVDTEHRSTADLLDDIEPDEDEDEDEDEDIEPDEDEDLPTGVPA